MGICLLVVEVSIHSTFVQLHHHSVLQSPTKLLMNNEAFENALGMYGHFCSQGAVGRTWKYREYVIQ